MPYRKYDEEECEECIKRKGREKWYDIFNHPIVCFGCLIFFIIMYVPYCGDKGKLNAIKDNKSLTEDREVCIKKLRDVKIELESCPGNVK